MQFYLQNMDKLTVRFNLSISIFVVDYRKQYWIILIKIFFKSPRFDFLYFSALFMIYPSIPFFPSSIMFQKNVTVTNTTHKKETRFHSWCGRVGSPGIGIYPVTSSKRDKAFFFYILIQNCLKKFDLDRETSSVWDGATLKYVQR